MHTFTYIFSHVFHVCTAPWSSFCRGPDPFGTRLCSSAECPAGPGESRRWNGAASGAIGRTSQRKRGPRVGQREPPVKTDQCANASPRWMSRLNAASTSCTCAKVGFVDRVTNRSRPLSMLSRKGNMAMSWPLLLLVTIRRRDGRPAGLSTEAPYDTQQPNESEKSHKPESPQDAQVAAMMCKPGARTSDAQPQALPPNSSHSASSTHFPDARRYMRANAANSWHVTAV